MNETKPASNNEPPEPPTGAPNESWMPSYARERIEQLVAAVAELETANDSLDRQLTSALAAEHTPILMYGEGTWQRSLNARSIKVLFLTPEIVPNSYPPRQSGKWAVMADETSLTDWLPEEEALTEYARAQTAWIVALEPPMPRK